MLHVGISIAFFLFAVLFALLGFENTIGSVASVAYLMAVLFAILAIATYVMGRDLAEDIDQKGDLNVG